MFILLPVFTFFSCTDITDGLFASLELESEIYNGTLPNDLTIGTMEKNGTYYYIAGGDFMYKNHRQLQRQPTGQQKNPEDLSGYLCQNFIILDNNVYCIFYNIDATSYKTMNTTVADPANISWSEIAFDDLSGETLIDLKQSGTLVFALTVDSSGKYKIYTEDKSTFAAGSDFTPIVIRYQYGRRV